MLENVREETVDTPYGSVTLRIGQCQGKGVAFLARHGSDHSVPPHKINYRANIFALAKIGVTRVIATNAVGSLRERMAPGHFVLANQFIDFTKGRPSTFFEGGEAGVAHVDMTAPYCPQLNGVLYETAKPLGITIHDGGTYVCTEGPRFETPAEIEMFQQWGGHLVGMTGVPEVVLAREAGLCYSSISMVTNYAAGLAGYPLTHEEVLQVMERNTEQLRDLIVEAIPRLPDTRLCGCGNTVTPLNFQKSVLSPEKSTTGGNGY